MKRSFSKWDLLHKKLTGMSDEYKGFFDYFLTNRKYLILSLPHYDYLRGIIFIEDLKDNYGDEIPFSFNIANLIYMLYDDFLNQVKMGAKNAEIALYLLKGKERYFTIPKREKRTMKAITKHLFEFESDEEEIELDSDKEEKITQLEIRLKETEILRAEVLLNDLVPYLKGHTLNVEQVMAIIYLDFINSVKNDGNSLKIQKSILAHIKRF